MSVYTAAVHNHLRGMDADEKGMLSALQTGNHDIAQKAMMKFLSEFNLSLSCLQMAWSEKTKLLHGMFIMIKHEQEHQQKVDYDANYKLVKEIIDGHLPEELGNDLSMLRRLDKNPVFRAFQAQRVEKLKAQAKAKGLDSKDAKRYVRNHMLALPKVLSRKTEDMKLEHRQAQNQHASKVGDQ